MLNGRFQCLVQLHGTHYQTISSYQHLSTFLSRVSSLTCTEFLFHNLLGALVFDNAHVTAPYKKLTLLLLVLFICSCVLPSRNVRLCTANKRMDLEVPIFAVICTRCMLTRYVRLQNFTQIFNVFDLHFQGQSF